MRKLSKTLGAFITASAVASAGCGKSEKHYQIYRYYLPECLEHCAINPYEVIPHSPARDSSPASEQFLAVVSESRMRELGLNPENYIEFNREQHLRNMNYSRGEK